MITATSKEHGTVKVNGLCNKGETLGTPWLITIPVGCGVYRVIAIAQNEQDALDIYADSNHSVLTKIDDVEPEDEGYYATLGNFGDFHDLSSFTTECLVPCTVNYFAKKDSV